MIERRYTPESELRHPVELLGQMLRDLRGARYLAWRILRRDLSARHRQTLLGYLWILLPPLAIALGLTLATRAEILRIAATDIPYPAYLVFSMSLWQTFSEALAGPPALIRRSRSVLARVYFPREALLVAGLGDILVNFTVRLVLIVAVFVVLRVPLSWSALASPPVAMVLIVLGYAIGLILAPLASLYEDLTRGIAIALTVWLFFSPVVYPMPSDGSAFGAVVRLNPVSPILVTARELAIGVPLSMPLACAVVAVLSVLGLCGAWLVCKVSMPSVIERLRA
jgi:lipopolysaccharide transport system permease protein